MDHLEAKLLDGCTIRTTVKFGIAGKKNFEPSSINRRKAEVHLHSVLQTERLSVVFIAVVEG